MANVLKEEYTNLSLFDDISSEKKTITYENINSLLGIKESFELSPKLYEKLLNKESRDDLLNKFINFEFDMSHDCLRDYFQNNNSDRKNLKQDYTPDCVCKLISQLIPSTDYIIDVCSGTGALTVSSYKNNIYFQCEEISDASIPLLLLNLCIRGMNATVLKKNVLTKEIEKIFRVTKDKRFSDISLEDSYIEEKASVIISNPPYSLSWEPKFDERFENYELPPKSKADYAFVLDILSRLKHNGKAFILLPTGVLFRGAAEGKIRKKLIDNNLIESIIGLPEKLFLNTDIPVIIMVLNKAKNDSDILFIDASKLYIKNGKKNNITDDDIKKITKAYYNRQNIEKLCNVVTMDSIIENDYNLNIPRYVDNSEPRESIDLAKTINDIVLIDEEIKRTNSELLSMIKQLSGTTSDVDNYYKENIEKFLKLFGS